MQRTTSTQASWAGTQALETSLPAISNNQSGIFLIEGTRNVQGTGKSATRNCYFVAACTIDSKGKAQLSFSEPFNRIKAFELAANPWEFRCVEFITTDNTVKGTDGKERTAQQRIAEHLSKEVTGGNFHVAREQQVLFLQAHGKSLKDRQLATAVNSITTTSY